MADVQEGQEQLALLRSELGSQYEILRLVGKGGMGAVYLARELSLDRLVALKVLPAELLASEKARERFRREARMAARLNHPSIVPLFSYGETESVLYYVMGYVDGESLQDRIHRLGTLPGDELKTLVKSLCDALDHAHRKGVVHRDIKPSNILIDGESGRVLLADFGIGRVMGSGLSERRDRAPERREGLTRTGAVLGTPTYLAPEQATGADADARSDIYSLAVTTYEAATGGVPFSGPSDEVVQARKLAGRHLPLTEARPDLDRGFSATIDKCLHPKPDRRPGTTERVLLLMEGLDRRASKRSKVLASRWRGITGVVTLLTFAGLAWVVWAPAIRSFVGGIFAPSYPSTPVFSGWETVNQDRFAETFLTTDSLLIMGAFRTAHGFDGNTWRPLSLADSVSIIPQRGKAYRGRALASGIGGRWWLLDAGATDLEIVDSLPRPIDDYVFRSFWSDGQALVAYSGITQKLTPDGWEVENLGTPAYIQELWGLDFSRRYALPNEPSGDSVLAFDGISWEWRHLFPTTPSARTWISNGSSFLDGSSAALAGVCDGPCRRVIIQQDTSGQVLREVAIRDGLGIPSADTVWSQTSFWQIHMSGLSAEDFYLWGSWSFSPSERERTGLLDCPKDRPCIWHVADGEVEPVEELKGRDLYRMALFNRSYYAVMLDGTFWRRMDGRWRLLGDVPVQGQRLIAVTPTDRFSLVLGSSAGISWENLGKFGIVSSSVHLPKGVVSEGVHRLEARDSILVILTSDGRAFRTYCRFAEEYDQAFDRSMPRPDCAQWDSLRPPQGSLVDVALAPGGEVLAIDSHGLASSWVGPDLLPEALPIGEESDSLWGIFVSQDGVPSIVGLHAAFERDSNGDWSTIRRFPRTVDGGGREFAVDKNGDLIVFRDFELWDSGVNPTGNRIRVWSRSVQAGDSIPIVALPLPQDQTSRMGIMSVHMLPDGRLVAVVDLQAERGIGGHLRVWQPPVREDQSQAVELPRHLHITDLDDDGTYLFVAGSTGIFRIPLDSLPFAGSVSHEAGGD